MQSPTPGRFSGWVRRAWTWVQTLWDLYQFGVALGVGVIVATTMLAFVAQIRALHVGWQILFFLGVVIFVVSLLLLILGRIFPVRGKLPIAKEEGPYVAREEITGRTAFSDVWPKSYESMPSPAPELYWMDKLDRLTLGEIALLDVIDAVGIKGMGHPIAVSRRKCEAILRAAEITEHPNDSIVKLEDLGLIVESETDKFIVNDELSAGTGPLREFKTLLTYNPQLVTAYRTVSRAIQRAGLMP